MRYLIVLAALLASLGAPAADYGRERKWAEEVLPSVLVGDPVWLAQANGHRFLGLYVPVDRAKAALVMVHGLGVHPDWGLIGALRQQLPEAGYATLSIQMPVLAADAKGDDYPPTFDEAADRLRLAVRFLKDKGYARVAIVAYSLGTQMAYRYLSRSPDAAVAAWVVIGSPAPLDLAGLRMPILDLYGQNDFAQVLENAVRRSAGLKQKGSAQVAIPGADHFYAGQDAALQEQVRNWLDQTL